MNNFTAPLSILQISDLHVLPHSSDKLLGVKTEHYFKEVLTHAHAGNRRFDLILVSGDLAQDPCLASYQRVYQILSQYQTPTVCLPGNHDDVGLMERVLNQELINCRKQLLFKHWQLINLNSQKLTDPGGLLLPQELDFLDECLAAEPHRHAIIAVHHHCTPSYSEWLDTMQIENHQELFACVAEYPQVKVITTGHIHQELETKEQGIAILGVPSTCFQFKVKSKNFALDRIAPGYRLIQLYPDGRFTTQVYRLEHELTELHTHSAGY